MIYLNGGNIYIHKINFKIMIIITLTYSSVLLSINSNKYRELNKQLLLPLILTKSQSWPLYLMYNLILDKMRDFKQKHNYLEQLKSNILLLLSTSTWNPVCSFNYI